MFNKKLVMIWDKQVRKRSILREKYLQKSWNPSGEILNFSAESISIRLRWYLMVNKYSIYFWPFSLKNLKNLYKSGDIVSSSYFVISLRKYSGIFSFTHQFATFSNSCTKFAYRNAKLLREFIYLNI